MSRAEPNALDRAPLPTAGPFGPIEVEKRHAGETLRALLIGGLALYPVLAAMAVVWVSLSLLKGA